MSHRSNGKHRFPASETTSRLPVETRAGSPWLTEMEDSLTGAHEAVVERATKFIRERPGASLVLAAAVGGLIGWFIKRRI